MGFKVARDLIFGMAPSPIKMAYNGDLATDGSTTRYKGSLVKMMDYNDIDHGGHFATHALLATAMVNFVGILDEEVTSGYLPEDADYDTPLKKIIPCFPSTVIRGEYVQADAAGTANYDTGATCSAASPTFTIDTDVTDEGIGTWIYMIDGASAGALHYSIDSTANASYTFATNMAKAVVSGDTFLVINTAHCREMLFNATCTGIKSESEHDLHVHRCMGLGNFISSPGMPYQRLQRSKHDGLIINNAKFYHEFTINALNAWNAGIAAS